MYPYRASAYLISVKHHVIRLCAHLCRIRFEHIKILVLGTRKWMMLSDEAVLLFRPLKQREVRHPQQIKPRIIDKIQPLCKLKTKRAERRIYRLIVRIGDKEQYVARLRIRSLMNFVYLLLRKEFGERALHTFGLHAHPSKTLRLVYFHKFCELVYIPPRQLFSGVLRVYTSHASAARKRFGKYFESAFLHYVGNILEFKSETRVRLIRAVPVHRLIIWHAPERKLHIETKRLF